MDIIYVKSILNGLVKQHNAALRCEQRYHETEPYHRKHKTQRWNEKCQALGITLKCFVMFILPAAAILHF